jgi:hypothetical protein
MNLHRPPLLLVLLAVVCAVPACSGSTHHRFRPRALSCGLQSSGRRGGRAVVTYDDQTGNSTMSEAIASEVQNWNGSSAPVVLEPAKSQPAITFRAVPGKAAKMTPCQGSTPRVVTVELSIPKWSAGSGVAGSVKDPVGAIARAIAHALGLAEGGKCPGITANKSCPHRRTTPGPAESAILQRLYAAAAASPSP